MLGGGPKSRKRRGGGSGNPKENLMYTKNKEGEVKIVRKEADKVIHDINKSLCW